MSDGHARGDLRLVVAALAAWAIAYVATGRLAPPVAITLIATAAVVTALVAMVLARRRAAIRAPRSAGSWRRRGCRQVAQLAAGVLVAGVAALLVAAHVAALEPSRAAFDADVVSGGRIVEASGVVSSKVEGTTTGGTRFRLEADNVRVGGVERARGVTLAVSFGAGGSSWDGHGEGKDAHSARPDDRRPPGLDLGAHVTVRGSAKIAAAGDAAVLRVFASRLSVTATPPPVLSGAGVLRDGFVTLARKLPGEGAHLLPGLSVGDTSLVDESLDAGMKASSLSHLTAVSGANCALVVGLAYALAAWCGARRGVRIAAALVTLGGFVVLVTPEPSVVRAAAMATIALLALALDRPGRGITTLAAAVVVLLVLDPWLSSSLGFALSAAATGALLVLARPLAHGLSRWMPRGLALALAVPLSAQLVCGPLLVLIDPRVPIMGVVANLLAAPAAPIATVVGLAACLCAGIPLIGVALAWIAWLPSAWIAAVAGFFAGMPGGVLPWPPGVVGAALLAGVGVIVLVAIALPARGRRSARLRAGAAAIVLVVAAAGVGLASVRGPLAPLTVPRSWSIAQCDVGQGDAVLLRSHGMTALIDTGPDEASLAECLRVFGVDRVDLLVLTHFDHDHVGAVDVVRGRVGTLVHGAPEGPPDQRIVDTIVSGGARAVRGHAGVTGALGDARWRVVWPSASGASTGAAFAAGNDGSVVLDVSSGGDPAMPSGLYLGDLSKAPQRALAAAGVGDHYDVVKVAHHGSADQSLELYASLRPAVALIGVGADNTYGHPRAEVLAALEGIGASIVRSDRDGLATVARAEDRVGATGNGELTLWRQRGSASGDRASAVPDTLDAWHPAHAPRLPRAAGRRAAEPPRAGERVQPNRSSGSSRGGAPSPFPCCWSRGQKRSAPNARSPACATT